MTLLHSTQGPTAHAVLEALAYFVGARVYWVAARRNPQPPARVDRWLLLSSVIFGAALGSKLLHVAEHGPWLIAHGRLEDWLGGKSVLGGFIGGTLAAELCKRAIGWPRSTGDAWVPALVVGLCIGRIGCQLSGTWDQTYGTPTSLPWGWDYGDGVMRHPAALYEILLLIALALGLRGRFVDRPGARFAALMLGYCVIRLGVDCLKPPFGASAPDSMPVALYAGLTAIQWAAIAGLAGFGLLLSHRLRDPAPMPA
jgi:phosphatidylglycerol:prolipoprotein diacylglycerol transferase